MGTKITFDPIKRKFVCDGPPVGGVIEIDLQVDLYSDGKEDWISDGTLDVMRFPVDALGGNPFGSTTFGDAYLITDGWTFKPYEGDHVLRLVGDVGTDDGRQLVDTSIGAFTITIEYAQSAIVKVVETGTSGLTPQESTALIDIDTNVDTLLTDVTAMSAVIDLLKVANDLTNEQANAEHITSRTTAKVILRNTTVSRRWEAPAWEDEAKTIPYGTNTDKGIEAVGMLVEVAWS